VLISPRHVLTAAHRVKSLGTEALAVYAGGVCIHGGLLGNYPSGPDTERLTVNFVLLPYFTHTERDTRRPIRDRMPDLT